MFETDFLGNTRDSREQYRTAIHEVVDVLCSSLPTLPYSGKTPADLGVLVNPEFLPTSGANDRLRDGLAALVSNSIAITHPHTAAHLHCPPLIPALAAEVVTSALNQSMDSFDQAPIATVLEQKLMSWLCREVGLPASADGTLTTGGTQSNYMGLLLARDAFLQSKWNWSTQKLGLPPEAYRLRILCSEVAHFTVEKSASQLGLGTDAVVRIPVDDRFRMLPGRLQESLKEITGSGLHPFAVVATAGTTDFGSIDPLPDISALAREAGAWLHIDAAYGGALLFAQNFRDRLRGIAAADSVSMDFHKLLWQPVPCGAFLLSDRRHFELMKLHADYLNPESHEEQGIPDLVTSSLLTSRRFDALKLWLSLQVLGRTKLSAMIERTITLANVAAGAIRRNSSLELIDEPQLSTVVFRYVSSRQGVDADQLNWKIKQALFREGIAVIGHTRVRGQQCLKFTCMNPTVEDSQIEDLVRIVAKRGLQLEQD